MNRRAVQWLVFALSTLPAFAYSIGILVPRAPEFSPIRLGDAEVRVEITNNMAKSRVIQDFLNPNPRQLEADFFFPVPKGANVTDFVLYMNGKPVKGEVLEKEKAREIYESIVRRMKDPGLIEWIDHDLFKVRVFPVPANGSQKIELEFAQPLESDQGLFRYAFPLRPPKSFVESARGGAKVKFAVDLKSDEPLANVYSPSHAVSTDMKDPKNVHVELTGSLTAGGGDFLLFYEPANKDVALSLLATRPGSEDGFFSLMLSPRVKEDTSKVMPSDIAFVIDTSGSMLDNKKIEQARRALTYCVSQLKPADRFTLIRFSTEVEKFSDNLNYASDENKERGKQWISQLEARGATNISGALREAVELKAKTAETTATTETTASAGRIYTIVFITDGMPTVGSTSADGILNETKKSGLGNVRIFTFGVGNDVNAKLLDMLASETRAAADYIRADQDMELPISRFFDKISRPALTNLKLEMTNAEVYDMYPKELPDLFYGTQLTVFGRYKKPGPTAIRLAGTAAGESAEFTYEKTLPEKETANDFVEKLWGTRKIGYLLDQIRANGESAEVKDEVVRLARKYGVVTPYTSYLVAEDVPTDHAPQSNFFVPNSPMAAARASARLLRQAQVPSGSSSADSYGWSAGEAVSRGDISRAPAPASGAAGYPAATPLYSLGAEGGSAGITASRAVKHLKEADSKAEVDEHLEQARSTGGHSFVKQGEVWTDTQIQGNEPTVLKIRYLSDAYFAAIRANRNLAEAFALGERVRVKLAAGIVEVGPEGKDSLDENDLKMLAP